MAASLSTLEAALKEFYLGTIQNQLNNSCELLNQFGMAESTQDASGKYAIVPFKLGRNSGVGARGAGGTLPTAGNQILDKLTLNYKFVYGRFAFDGPALAAMKKGTGAFASVTEVEMDGLVDDVKKYQNVTSFLGGSVIGLCWNKGNTAAKDFSGRMSAPVGGANQVSLILLRTGLPVVGSPQPLVSLIAGAAADVMTMGAAIETTDGVGVDTGGTVIEKGDVFAVVHNSPDLAVEPNGLLGNMCISDYYGISRVTEASIRSVSRTADNKDLYTNLSLPDLDALGDLTATNSGEEITQYWFNRRQRQEYTSLLQGTNAANLYVDVAQAGKSGDAGFKPGALGYNGVPIKVDVDCPRGTIFGINHKKWKKVELRAGGFDEDYGQMLNRVPNQDAVEGFWKAYYEVFCQKPNGAGFITAVAF